MVPIFAKTIVLLFIVYFSFSSTQITDEQKAYLLNLHNSLRGDLLQCKVAGQPPVKGDLPLLKWNDGLADKAKEWAANCVLIGDNEDERIVSPFKYVGQNIAAGYRLESSVQHWVDERTGYDWTNLACKMPPCEHYTQMVWNETTDIGCSVTDCEGKGGLNYNLSIVCNYGPGGNLVGKGPYTAGSTEDCHSTEVTKATSTNAEPSISKNATSTVTKPTAKKGAAVRQCADISLLAAITYYQGVLRRMFS